MGSKVREQLSIALAKWVGHVLTLDVAKEIACSANTSPDRHIDPARFPVEKHGDYTLQCERLRDALPALRTQREAYLTECYPEREQAIKWDRMLDLARSGALVIFTARGRQDGAVLGSMWLIPGESLDRDALTVSDLMFYVSPERRGSPLAGKLFRYSEQCIFSMGIREASFHFRLDNGADRMARYMGYTPHSIRVTKAHHGDLFAEVPTRHKEA